MQNLIYNRNLFGILLVAFRFALFLEVRFNSFPVARVSERNTPTD